jgi:hypothetical protein
MSEELKNSLREILGISQDQNNSSSNTSKGKNVVLSPEQEIIKNSALEIMGIKKN